MKTSDYKTKTLIADRRFVSKGAKWVVGLDIGYSGVKVISPNTAACFPAYARKIPEGRMVLKEPADTDIRYRNKEGTWTVGALAYEEVIASEVADSEAELYGRHRYHSDMFHVLAEVGLALGLRNNGINSVNGKTIYVQTGLPPKYMDGETDDRSELTDVLAGHHEFDLQIGKSDWKHFSFDISEKNVEIMPQPLGSLISVSVGQDGRMLPVTKKYFSSTVVIFDPGFGTLDDYMIVHGNVVGIGNTFSNLGMKEVFVRTVKDIQQVYGVSLTVAELQNKLENGTVKYVNKKEHKSDIYDFTSLLETHSKAVCSKAIEKMDSVHDYFSEVDYIVATGGTYDAWKEDFDSKFTEMQGLEIIPGNINEPDLPNIFSNVRGYYYFLTNRL